MAGVSDLPFRLLCREQGAGLVCMEMVSAKALVYHDEKTKQLLWSPPDEHPAAVQIFGHEPEVMAEAAPMALAYSGADILDINMGCPVGKVIRSGDGSALMRDPELAGRIIEAVVKAVDVPVTVKFRKGWDGGNVNAVAFAQMCQQAGAAAIAVHGRTRVQMYAGRADWDIIRDVKRAVTIPVIANGDIDSGEKARRVMALTGADGVMIGRASYGNPWIFSEVGAALGHLPERKAPGLEERHAVICDHMRRHFDYYGGARGAVTFRKHLSHYLKGLPGSEALLGELFATSDADVLGAAVSRYFERLQDDEQGLG